MVFVTVKFSALDTFYGALASVILGFIWLSVSVSSLLFGAALAVEWAARMQREEVIEEPDEEDLDREVSQAV